MEIDLQLVCLVDVVGGASGWVDRPAGLRQEDAGVIRMDGHPGVVRDPLERLVWREVLHFQCHR
jgi:hypothetical protein|nr:hypothetical protein [Aeromicrobium sp.]